MYSGEISNIPSTRTGLSSHKEGQFPPLSRRIIINTPSFDYRRGTESTVGFITIQIARRDATTTPLKVSEIGLLVGALPSLNHRHLRPKFDLIIKWMACIFLEDFMITAIVKEMHNIKTRDIINKVALQKNHQHH